MALFDATIGALEVGILLSTFLFGFATVQVYDYIRNYPRDPSFLKAYVVAIWLLELAHTALIFHAIYIITVSNYGQPETANSVPPSFGAALVITAITVPLIQTFFANRVRILSRSWLLTTSCALLVLLRFISFMGTSFVSLLRKDFTELRSQWDWVLIVAFSIALASDLLITVASCFFLVKRNTGVPSTIGRFSRLTAWVIQTCFLTTLVTLLTLVLYLTLHNFAWITLVFVNSKFFTNELLTTLNARIPHTSPHEVADTRKLSTLAIRSSSISARSDPRNVQDSKPHSLKPTRRDVLDYPPWPSVTPDTVVGEPNDDSALELVDASLIRGDRRSE